MSDIGVLCVVTGVVLLALLVWAGFVLFTAPDAPDDSPEGRAKRGESSGGTGGSAPPAGDAPKGSPSDPPPKGGGGAASALEVIRPTERAVAVAGKAAPVVIMPVMRHRLDSHTEIRDDVTPAPPEGGDDAARIVVSAPASQPGAIRESVLPPSGPPMSLISAIGRAEPAHGPTEMSAIVDRHRLFILADGAGQRVQHELVSSVVVDGLAAAFEADVDEVFPADATLPRRADRLRRSVLVADTVLRSRAKGGDLDVSRVGVLAAHFTPDNRSLYIATAGRDRAYRLRGDEVVQLNKPSLVPTSVEGPRAVDMVLSDTAAEDVYVFGTDAAFLAVGDELRSVLTSDRSIDRVAAHFVAAATRGAKRQGMTAIVVRVEPPKVSQRPVAV